MRKKENEEVFMSQLFHDNNLYIVAFGREENKTYISYMTVGNSHPSLIYTVNNHKIDLQISDCFTDARKDIKMYIQELDDNCGKFFVTEKNKEIYSQQLNKEELEVYITSLLYHVKPMIEKANNGLKRLNPTLFELLISYFPLALEFQNLLQASTSSSKPLTTLFDQYFCENKLKKGHQKVIEPKK